ncbi:MAG: hypothetical protein M0D55_10880 [Elusimicrobiota bacterium]|nr:MAG: hypothetical protein M0D55_10880 [Elusimicrobiota bacterium]
MFLLFSAKAAPMLLLPLSQAGVTLPPPPCASWTSANGCGRTGRCCSAASSGP